MEILVEDGYILGVFFNTYHILLSDSNEPGEGEHKIIEYLRHTDTSDRTVSIYGLDADLIMLCMSSKKDKILLLREAVEFNNTIHINGYKFFLTNIQHVFHVVVQH